MFYDVYKYDVYTMMFYDVYKQPITIIRLFIKIYYAAHVDYINIEHLILAFKFIVKNYIRREYVPLCNVYTLLFNTLIQHLQKTILFVY